MYRFRDSHIQKEFYLERFAERLEFRKNFSYFIVGLLVLWILNELFYGLDKSVSWTYFICNTTSVILIVGLYMKITKLKFFRSVTQGKKIYYVDFFIFLPMLLFQCSFTVVSVWKGIAVSQEDGLNGYFYAFDTSMTFVWTLALSEFLITNWTFQIIYFVGYWIPITATRAIYLPSLSGLFLDVKVLMYFIIIVFFQERSSRLNFVTKRDRQKKIEMFETILKRIHEQIVVFNRKMEVKYSNIAAGGLPEETQTLSDKQSPEYILQEITSLKLLTGSRLNTDFAKMFDRAESEENVNLTQCLEQIAATDELYNELGDKDFIQIEGKSSGTNIFNKISRSSEARYYTLQLFTNCLHDEECIVVIIKDITKHISMLEEKNKLQSNLLSSISHELKTPLGISLTLIDKAIEEDKTPFEMSKKYLVPASNYSKMLTFFICDVMDFIKMQKNEFQLDQDNFCIENLLDEISQLFSSSFDRKNIFFRFEYDSSIHTIINNDAQRLKQILVGLLANAIKYTMQGTITLGFKSLDELSYLFFIQDTGIGIKAEELEILNKKLDSINFGVAVNANSTGAGIGLIVANAIAKRLSPNQTLGLTIESEFEVGSKFSFRVENVFANTRKQVRPPTFVGKIDEWQFPKEKARSILVSSFRNSEDLFSLKQRPKTHTRNKMHLIQTEDSELPLKNQALTCCCRRILVADDEVFNTVAVEMICKPFGFSVDCAFNGQQALELIQKRSSESCCSECKPYNLIIMDCNMPIMNGYQATRCIREAIKSGIWRDMVIVGCTAYEGKEKLEECLKSGMSIYVKKPLDRSKFSQLLAKFNI